MPVDLSAITKLERLPTDGDSAGPALVRDRPAGNETPRDHEWLAGVPILVVDDDAPSARLLRVLLAGAGAVVRTAHNADEALALLADFPAQLFVVDLILPGMSGLLLAQRVKEASPTAVVVAVSVAHGPDVERLALESGCATLIHKPIDVNTFVQSAIRLLRTTA